MRAFVLIAFCVCVQLVRGADEQYEQPKYDMTTRPAYHIRKNPYPNPHKPYSNRPHRPMYQEEQDEDSNLYKQPSRVQPDAYRRHEQNSYVQRPKKQENHIVYRRPQEMESSEYREPKNPYAYPTTAAPSTYPSMPPAYPPQRQPYRNHQPYQKHVQVNKCTYCNAKHHNERRPSYEVVRRRPYQHRVRPEYEQHEQRPVEYEQERQEVYQQPQRPHRYQNKRPSHQYQKPKYSTNEDQYAMASSARPSAYENNQYEAPVVKPDHKQYIAPHKPTVYQTTYTTTTKAYTKPATTTMANVYEAAPKAEGYEEDLNRMD